MNKMNSTTWILPPVKEEARNLSAGLGIPLGIAQIMARRNISDLETAHKFLFGTLNDLHDPYLLDGMEKAVTRIRKAISFGENILVFGDYDVDGILSVVILSEALGSLGAKVDYYIPDRMKDGYGIKEKYVDIALKRKSTLAISVDCGIKAIGFVKRAKKCGIDVIITDHHQPGGMLPESLAVLNPVIRSSGYPDKDLAGIGVVFKLIQALFKEAGKSSAITHYIKFVSIGTIADVAALRGENRLFIKFGLKSLERDLNNGLKCLMKVCGLEEKKISVGDVGFRIGPRINAAGRMGKADLAVELFFSDNFQKSTEIACQLDRLNLQRQKVEERIYSQAIEYIKKKSLDKKYKLLILGCDEWHRGVIGIVASKLKDFFNRPVILFAYEDGKAFGSGRSISEFSLIECIDKNREFFLSFGGHPMAVGCELDKKNIGSLKEAVNDFVSSKILEEHLRKKIYIDTIINFNEINSAFLENMSFLSPFGVGNSKPVFLSKYVQVVDEPKRIKRRHSKFLVKQGDIFFEALGWGRGEWIEDIQKGDRIDIVYSLQFSEYLGQERLNLSLRDIRKSNSSVCVNTK